MGDSRIRLVVGPRAGPTTKADCLNTLWRALIAEEQAQGWRAKAIVLHDAEDVIHSGEFDLTRLDEISSPTSVGYPTCITMRSPA